MRRRAAAGVAALGLLAGCGGDGGGGLGGTDSGSGDREATRTVERTTRVEVVEQRGAATDGFDARRVYERDGPGVVTVFSVFGDSGDRERDGVGSGFVVGEDGEILTNAHVVTSGEGKDIAKAKQVYVQFADRNQVGARVVGFDPNSDLALLRVDPAGLALRPLPLGDADTVRVGEPVAAIGSPYGEPQSLSVGVVSAKDRSIESLTGFTIPGALQTDAAVNRGNSGGPLVDARGRVIGINSQIRSTGGGGEGVGFAVSVQTVRRVLRALRKGGEVRYAFLGVETAPVYPQLDDRFKLGTDAGAWVQGVTDGGPADDGGIRAGDDDDVVFQARAYNVGGDVITRVAGVALESPDDLSAELTRFAPGETITLEVFRDGRPRRLRVTLGERPEANR